MSSYEAKKKLNYYVKFKLCVVEECLESGLSRREVAKNYGLNESTIRGWCKQKETLK